MKYLLFSLLFLFNILAQSINISVNQVGYLTDEQKYAVINGDVQKLFLFDSNNEIVFENNATLITNNDPATSYKTYLFDFSSFKQKGVYYIGDNAGLKSYSFEIGDNVFEELKYLSIKSYYYQRCGVPLLEQYIGKTHSRPICHTKDATFHPTAGSGSKDATGGWHDAGDYGKYTAPAATTVGQLLIAYENYGSKFQEDNFNIPESGNGVPDLLDEVRFELEWMLKMQRDTDGAVYWMVNTKNYFENMPNLSTATRYLYEVSTMATGDFAAVMAIANRIYKQYDPNFAQTCLEAAVKAWGYLEANPTMIPVGGYKNPTDTHAGGYSMSQDKDKRLWAASELFRTTEEVKYNTYFVNNYSTTSAFWTTFGWASVNSLAHLSYLLIDNSKVNTTVKNNIRNQLIQYSNSVINTTNKDGYQVGMGTGDYYWGSNGVALNKAFILVFAHILTNDKKYYDSALKQLNYILGVNAHNMTFVSGVGTKSPLYIHHAPSYNKVAVPGFVVGGPERYLSDPVLKSKFTSSTPPALCYIDHVGSYAANEITIYWNSGLVTLAGYFTNNLTSINDNSVNKNNDNSEINAYNYPNPFNSSTKINFKINVEDYIKLVIFDSIGRKVLEKDYGNLNPGLYNFDWNGKNYLNQDVASGVYIYQIIGKNEKYYTNKMVLLK